MSVFSKRLSLCCLKRVRYQPNIDHISCQENMMEFGNVILNQIGYYYGNKMIRNLHYCY